MTKLIRFHFHRLCLVILLLTSTIGCDQATKMVARDSIRLTGPHNYFGQMITLVYAENPGAFLNLGATLPSAFRFLIFTLGVAAFLLVTLLYLLRSTKLNKWQIIGISLLLGGGLGNLIDRVIRGNVIDFINLGIGDLRTGIFNIADVAVVAGVLILFLTLPKKSGRENVKV